MSKHRSCLLALAVALCALLSACATAPAAAERVLSIHADIVVHDDATLAVRQTITILSAGDRIKHGISWGFANQYPDGYGASHPFEFTLEEVLRDGQPSPYSLEATPDSKNLVIADKDVLLPPGEHTYTIALRTGKMIQGVRNREALYWVVVGRGWAFPIDAASATVTLPPGVTPARCLLNGYTGAVGAVRRDLAIRFDESGRATFHTTRGLAPGEGMTIGLSWSKESPAGGQDAAEPAK